jgi:DNA-damage-inducible protein J
MLASIRETTSVKLDRQSKDKVKLVSKELGITMGDVFNMSLSQGNLHKGIPFDIKILNETTKQVIKKSRQRKNMVDFSTGELK